MESAKIELSALLDKLNLGFQNNEGYTQLHKAADELSQAFGKRENIGLLVQSFQCLSITSENNINSRPCLTKIHERIRKHQQAGISGTEGIRRIQAVIASAIANLFSTKTNPIGRLLIPLVDLMTIWCIALD